MSEKDRINPGTAKTEQPIETIYTTIESQPDRTDWLTVVSNLRQINRQLVEQIARLEQALASSKQTVHTYKEEKQTNEITILQQQDELKIVHDRVGALFQQLETSHQIGQRQQTLIETISQQLEITQAIIPQLEAENGELDRKYQEQAQQLTKTEQVALELHRRMKHNSSDLNDETETVTTPEISVETSAEATTFTAVENTSVEITNTSQSSLITTIESLATEPEIEIIEANAEQTVIVGEILAEDIPVWTAAPTALSWTTPPANPSDWREAIANSTDKIIEDPTPKNFPSPTLTANSAEVANKESTASVSSISTKKSSLNWPAPTLKRTPSPEETSDAPPKKLVIDLPKFPKRK